jgi:hypothetical protein
MLPLTALAAGPRRCKRQCGDIGFTQVWAAAALSPEGHPLQHIDERRDRKNITCPSFSSQSAAIPRRMRPAIHAATVLVMPGSRQSRVGSAGVAAQPCSRRAHGAHSCTERARGPSPIPAAFSSFALSCGPCASPETNARRPGDGAGARRLRVSPRCQCRMRPMAPATSAMRAEKPHSLSYQASTRTVRPPTTLV